MLPWEEDKGLSSQEGQESPYVLWSQRLQGCGSLPAFIYEFFACQWLFARLLKTKPS